MLQAALETVTHHRDLARILLLEAVSLGAAYEAVAPWNGRWPVLSN
jgi:chromosome condensin MukBEF complex kleisin-like MukF subunit